MPRYYKTKDFVENTKTYHEVQQFLLEHSQWIFENIDTFQMMVDDLVQYYDENMPL